MKNQRQEDILRIVSALDISPSMYKTAVEKYENLSDFLQESGIDCDIYPQGSFALGTVVRPNAKDPNAGYDLDFICQVKSTKDNISPEVLWTQIEQALKSNEIYRKRLEIFDKCFTIHYADIEDISFSIDIVPAADEALSVKVALAKQSERPDLVTTAIAIPTKPNYIWTTNNPLGYRKWFEEINDPFQEYGRAEFRTQLFNAHRSIYNKVEDIPVEMERSPLQRVIQILKRHRDYYYVKLKNGDELKPISAIISTFVASIAKNQPANISVYELLALVLEEFKIYSNHQLDETNSFSQRFPGKTLIRKESEKWIMDNPANPEDNLVDAWNTNGLIHVHFFSWIKAAHNDLILALDLEDSQFRSFTENAFGAELVHSVIGDKYSHLTPKPISYASTAKPWKK